MDNKDNDNDKSGLDFYAAATQKGKKKMKKTPAGKWEKVDDKDEDDDSWKVGQPSVPVVGGY